MEDPHCAAQGRGTQMHEAAPAGGKKPRGVVCPICLIKMKSLYTRSPQGHITRRRGCKRCALRVTTSERIVGGYTTEDIAAAKKRLELETT